jgi:hypothetical protein
MCHINIYDCAIVTGDIESRVLYVKCCRYWITRYENKGTTLPFETVHGFILHKYI